jgi:pyruvate dehydrogenase E1 component alpha subunit
MSYPKELCLCLLKKMMEIRLFEEKLIDLYARGYAVGIIHLSIGQEAVAAGVCAHLKKDDYVFSNHRGHGHLIAKGGQLKPMMAELFGKVTGYCEGKGGSMHIVAPDIGHLGAMGIVGSGLPIAAGAGLASKIRQSGQVSVCFFGDGASNLGFFHEALNFSSLHKLPVIFVCENNLYAVSVSQKRSQAIENIADRGVGYKMPGLVVDGQDIFAVYEAARQAVQRAREGDGPTLLECKTYRFRGHHEGDPNLGTRYRTKEEIAQWKERCPIRLLEKKLFEDRVIQEADRKQMEAEITKEIEEAVAFSLASPFPEPAKLLDHVFVR